jgi:hypothetical protein
MVPAAKMVTGGSFLWNTLGQMQLNFISFRLALKA